MKINNQSLSKMRIRGAVSSFPPSSEDMAFLEKLEKIWGDADLLRSQLATFSRARREILIDTCVYAQNWERWAYSRFYNNNGAFGHATPRRPNVFLEIKKIFKKIDPNIHPDVYIHARLVSIQKRAGRIRRERSSQNSNK